MDLPELAQAHMESKRLHDLATTCEKTGGLTSGRRIKKPNTKMGLCLLRFLQSPVLPNRFAQVIRAEPISSRQLLRGATRPDRR